MAIAVFLGLVGVPLLLPVLEAGSQGFGFWNLAEFNRLLGLAKNTIYLVAATLLVALPLGTVLALLLFRTNLPGRHFFLFVFFLIVFIPLPVLVSVWQAALGPGSWLPLVLWQPRPGQPLTQGFLPAIWVHSLAALPWTVLIIGQNLLRIPRELEEQAWQIASPLCVVWQVTLPRCGGALILASVFVAAQVAAEIAVTDLFLVRTFAEETYRVFSEDGEVALARAVALSLPPTLLLALVLWAGLAWVAKTIPALQSWPKPALRFSLRCWRWPAFALVAMVAFLLVVIPVATLSWRAGLAGSPTSWSLNQFRNLMGASFLINGGTCFDSLLWAMITACLATSLAFWLNWRIHTSGKTYRWWVGSCAWFLLAAIWAVPAPVLGMGLRKEIQGLDRLFPQTWIGEVLYYGQSPVPLIWAGLIRCLPFAMAVLWPVSRLFPRDLKSAATLEGATPGQQLFQLILPFCLVSLVGSIFVTLALALADVGASKLAATPGIETITLLVFDRMHYGVAQDVASLSLLLLLLIGFGGAEIALRRKSLNVRQSL